jgi:phosphotransferase system  glucose/maltose/N-acetylglucosamine-specific IIC component
MKKLISWFSGLLEDQGGSASSKRLVMYIFVFIFWMQVKADISGAEIDPQILYATIGVILFCIGAVTAEFFNQIKSTNTKTTTETEKKEQNG